VRPPRTKLAGVALAAGAAAGLGACVLAVSAYTFRRRSRSAAETAPCIECRFLAQLEESKRARLDGDLPRYFLTLEQLLRAYLRAKYCIGSLEDWHAPANGPAGLDERTMAVARELAHMAQRVRYAGYAPSAHEQRRMHEFLHSLFIRNQPRRQTPDEHLYLHMENAV